MASQAENELMPVEEIVRRLRAMLKTPAKLRPISIDKLGEVADVSDRLIYNVCEHGTMQKRTQIRFSRALKLLENGQIVVKKCVAEHLKIKIIDPKPPQKLVHRIKFTENGPKIQTIAVNPNAFTDIGTFGR
jgi:hypothetical protein